MIKLNNTESPPVLFCSTVYTVQPGTVCTGCLPRLRNLCNIASDYNCDSRKALFLISAYQDTCLNLYFIKHIKLFKASYAYIAHLWSGISSLYIYYSPHFTIILSPNNSILLTYQSLSILTCICGSWGIPWFYSFSSSIFVV